MCDRTLTGLKDAVRREGSHPRSVEPAANGILVVRPAHSRRSNRIKVELVEHQPCVMTLCPDLRWASYGPKQKLWRKPIPVGSGKLPRVIVCHVEGKTCGRPVERSVVFGHESKVSFLRIP